jgi:hypothetical protein
MWQHRLHRLFVADEIVIDEIQMAAIAGAIEGIQLGEDLLRRLDPRRAAIKLDDVAELAGKRAAAGKLDAVIDLLIAL